MEKTNINDGLGNPIIFGKFYGYSTDNSGVTQSVVGKANKFTPSGMVQLSVIHALKGLWMDEPEIVKLKKTVSVKSMKLFPIPTNCVCNGKK